jgi:hypothetical protein
VHFLGWLGFKNDADAFLTKAKSEPKWVEGKIVEYLKLQKDRAAKGEISLSTVVNFKKPVKLFLDMNLESTDIKPNWSKQSERCFRPRGGMRRIVLQQLKRSAR